MSPTHVASVSLVIVPHSLDTWGPSVWIQPHSHGPGHFWCSKCTNSHMNRNWSGLETTRCYLHPWPLGLMCARGQSVISGHLWNFRAADIFASTSYMSFPVTTSLFSIHSMFPIHTIAIWLLITQRRGNLYQQNLKLAQSMALYGQICRS